MNGPQGIIQCEISQRQIPYDLTYYMEYKKQQSIQRTHGWLPEVGGEKRAKRAKGVKRCKLPVMNSGDVMCSVVTIVNNTVLHIGKLLKE